MVRGQARRVLRRCRTLAGRATHGRGGAVLCGCRVRAQPRGADFGKTRLMLPVSSESPCSTAAPPSNAQPRANAGAFCRAPPRAPEAMDNGVVPTHRHGAVLGPGDFGAVGAMLTSALRLCFTHSKVGLGDLPVPFQP